MSNNSPMGKKNSIYGRLTSFSMAVEASYYTSGTAVARTGSNRSGSRIVDSLTSVAQKMTGTNITEEESVSPLNRRSPVTATPPPLPARPSEREMPLVIEEDKDDEDDAGESNKLAIERTLQHHSTEVKFSEAQIDRFASKGVYSLLDPEALDFSCIWYERLAPASTKFIPPADMTSIPVHVTLPSEYGENPTITEKASSRDVVDAAVKEKEDTLIICGWMLKKGGATHIYSSAKYKRRYFELTGTALCYYEKGAPESRKLVNMPSKDAATSPGISTSPERSSSVGSEERPSGSDSAHTSPYSAIGDTATVNDCPTNAPECSYVENFSHQDNARFLKGSIDLDTVTSIRSNLEETATHNKGMVFDLVTPTRVWCLCVENPGYLNTWLKAICNIVKRSAVSPEFKPFVIKTPEDSYVTTIDITVPITATIRETIVKILQEFKAKVGKDLGPTPASGYILKVTGLRDYLLRHDVPLTGYEYVRNCVHSSNPLVHLKLIKSAVTIPKDILASKSDSKLPLNDLLPVNLFEGDENDGKDKKYFSIENINFPLCVTILGIEGIYKELKTCDAEQHIEVKELDDAQVISIKMEVFRGGQVLPYSSYDTPYYSFAHSIKFSYPNRFITGSLLCNLPSFSRIVFKLYCICKSKPEPYLLATVGVQLIDFQRYLVQGKMKLRMWPAYFNASSGPLTPCFSDAFPYNHLPTLHLQFDYFGKPVRFLPQFLMEPRRLLGLSEPEAKLGKSGWMFKQGKGSYTQWRKRWFVLEPKTQTLAYWVSDSDFRNGVKPKGVIELNLNTEINLAEDKNRTFKSGAGSTFKEVQTYCFSISKPVEKRVYLIYTNVHTETQEWMDAIATVCLLAKEHVSGPRTKSIAPVMAAAATSASSFKSLFRKRSADGGETEEDFSVDENLSLSRILQNELFDELEMPSFFDKVERVTSTPSTSKFAFKYVYKSRPKNCKHKTSEGDGEDKVSEEVDVPPPSKYPPGFSLSLKLAPHSRSFLQVVKQDHLLETLSTRLESYLLPRFECAFNDPKILSDFMEFLHYKSGKSRMLCFYLDVVTMRLGFENLDKWRTDGTPAVAVRIGEFEASVRRIFTTYLDTKPPAPGVESIPLGPQIDAATSYLIESKLESPTLDIFNIALRELAVTLSSMFILYDIRNKIPTWYQTRAIMRMSGPAVLSRVATQFKTLQIEYIARVLYDLDFDEAKTEAYIKADGFKGTTPNGQKFVARNGMLMPSVDLSPTLIKSVVTFLETKWFAFLSTTQISPGFPFIKPYVDRGDPVNIEIDAATVLVKYEFNDKSTRPGSPLEKSTSTPATVTETKSPPLPERPPSTVLEKSASTPVSATTANSATKSFERASSEKVNASPVKPPPISRGVSSKFPESKSPLPTTSPGSVPSTPVGGLKPPPFSRASPTPTTTPSRFSPSPSTPLGANSPKVPPSPSGSVTATPSPRGFAGVPSVPATPPVPFTATPSSKGLLVTAVSNKSLPRVPPVPSVPGSSKTTSTVAPSSPLPKATGTSSATPSTPSATPSSAPTVPPSTSNSQHTSLKSSTTAGINAMSPKVPTSTLGGGFNPSSPKVPMNPVSMSRSDYYVPERMKSMPRVLEINEAESDLTGEKEFDPRSVKGSERNQLAQIMGYDPLTVLSSMDKALFWKHRYGNKEHQRALSKFLKCIHWESPLQVRAVYALLKQWAPPVPPVSIIELLDHHFVDHHVRLHAIKHLSTIPDSLLVKFVPQMCQALKFEPYYDSPLYRFLLGRSLLNPLVFGVQVFWAWTVESEHPSYGARYKFYLDQYLKHCTPNHRVELETQVKLWGRTGVFAEVCKNVLKYKKSGKDTLKKQLKIALGELQSKKLLPEHFMLPLDPTMQVDGLIIEKCRVMDSAKLPLWLVFSNSDKSADGIYIMFKSGDDLRQDSLTLQMIRIMDEIWANENLHLGLSPYKVLATWPDGGLLEIVRNSVTTADIQTRYGGKFGAYDDTTFESWIRDNNSSEEEYKKAVDAFVRSCAGYCVATYVMGVGDRHNDNIMIKKSGHYFHIDFGHILGNFKYQFGIKRERSAFVFTPEMAHVMGGVDGEEFKKFENLCCLAFNALRKHGNTLINLFSLMVPAGMPELSRRQDINYLRDMMLLNRNNEEAKEVFRKEIRESLNDKFKRFDNMIHILKHA